MASSLTAAPMNRFTALLSLACLVGGGCVQCEYSFPDIAVDTSGILAASGDLANEVLTVAVVQGGFVGGYPELWAAPDTLTPKSSADRRVELAYAIDGRVFDQTPRSDLVAVTEGDTVYVYVEGVADLVREVCSPSEGPFYEVLIQSVRAPESVRAVVVTTVPIDALPSRVTEALRRADAERLGPMTVV